MDCEQAAHLISSRVDGELADDDGAVLDAHLAACATCRAALEAAVFDDAAMVRAFAEGRDAAAALGRRVETQVTGLVPASYPMSRAVANDPGPRGLMRWAGWCVAAAAGFVGAVILMRPAGPAPTPSPWALQAAEPVARLALASGEVFMCPSDDQPWQPMAQGSAVGPGAKVRTTGAKCELTLPGGSRLRLNSDTELCFTAARDVQLTGGQIWSAVPHDASPLRIAAGEAKVTTGGAVSKTMHAPAAQCDVARMPNAATVTVVAGSARVNRQGESATVRGGQSLRIGTTGSNAESPSPFACTPVSDPVQATRWLDDLLVLLPADDPEVSARVDALLARIVAEQSGPRAATGPGAVERDVRALGQAWAAPMARYATDHLSAPAEADRDKRRTAARLLADFAPPACVANLIPLLADDDAIVRFHTAAALNRITGQTLGFSPDRCAATPRDPAPVVAWQKWWARNHSRYPAAKS